MIFATAKRPGQTDLAATLRLSLKRIPLGCPLNHCKTAIVNFGKHLFPPHDSTDWSLLRDGSRQVLPCPVPFHECAQDVMPAVQGYVLGQFADARRFIELRRLATEHADAQQWTLRLVECMLNLEQGRADAAWKHLQLGLTWRACQEPVKEAPAASSATAVELGVRDYLIMATVALASDRIEAAETYASRAIEQIENDPSSCLSDVLQDTRADAMLVFATIRLHQQRPGEAETLLQYAYDAHMQAGDIEQVATGLLLQADIELAGGRLTTADSFLGEARRLLSEKCDDTRHLRQSHLCTVVEKQLRLVRARLAAETGSSARYN
ncbi:MAG: hypothetical protein NXI04_27135 [Planctomycetaceae bacterium]|nr:hypothetical protein [Planctomycetaceae bacterium]